MTDPVRVRIAIAVSPLLLQESLMLILSRAGRTIIALRPGYVESNEAFDVAIISGPVLVEVRADAVLRLPEPATISGVAALATRDGHQTVELAGVNEVVELVDRLCASLAT